jgi:predicted ester cyclase
MMTSTEEQNLAIARIFIEQFLGKGDMAIAADVLDENVQAITGLKQDIFAAGDRVVVRFRSVQKHTKAFFGIAATNRDITFIETHVMRLREGKIVENVVSATNLEFEMLMAPVLTPLILQ